MNGPFGESKISETGPRPRQNIASKKAEIDTMVGSLTNIGSVISKLAIDQRMTKEQIAALVSGINKSVVDTFGENCNEIVENATNEIARLEGIEQQQFITAMAEMERSQFLDAKAGLKAKLNALIDKITLDLTTHGEMIKFLNILIAYTSKFIDYLNDKNNEVKTTPIKNILLEIVNELIAKGFDKEPDYLFSWMLHYEPLTKNKTRVEGYSIYASKTKELYVWINDAINQTKDEWELNVCHCKAIGKNKPVFVASNCELITQE